MKSGVSTWARTARLSAILEDGTRKDYFLKLAYERTAQQCITGQGARALVQGEYHSAVTINQASPGLVPAPCGWGQYDVGTDETCFFYICDFHQMRFDKVPDRKVFAEKIAEMHKNGKSPTGMFGYPVKTVIGKLERTVTWEESWAACFTNLLGDAIKYDNDTNGVWPALDAACNQLIGVVIPRLLGALQSDGRSIAPALVHGDLWENNVGHDESTGKIVVFDPGCTYAHNEMEFGTWRCRWTTYFRDAEFLHYYKRAYTVSDPKEEWDDRNRLYSIHPYLIDSAGHRGSISRETWVERMVPAADYDSNMVFNSAYNDVLFLCEKYGPLESLEKYDPRKDVATIVIICGLQQLDPQPPSLALYLKPTHHVTTSFFNYSPYMSTTSAPASQWADAPIALVATPQRLTGKTDLFTAGATHMALVHNALIRGFNSIYQQAPYIDEQLSHDFVRYSLTWASFVTSHHHDEEDNLFGKVSDLLDDATIWTATHKEHESFIDGVVQFQTYLTSLSTATELSADELLRIMDSFRAPLDNHLHSEVRTIAALAAHPNTPAEGSEEAAAAALVFKTWGKNTVTKAGMLDVVPFFFLNLDRTFENGLWAQWPPMPGPIRWILTNVVGTYHGSWWRFASCGSDGRPRELLALELHAKKRKPTQRHTASLATSAGENPTAHADEL
ncbi:Protein kinase-like domain [Cordyceps militaris CM01]|uniref:protein-ribulosamine 3-kinase n=1 Tax=Cordyceps militaris (strain CM01) TaxID=983644 RepID=G3J794_CORMM|nr:Protein kinase-like domain [Cordyceps militaris CM01]EGX95467.1 Protein kinase-like domain [Cordyceps militaris CM01]